MSIRFECDCGKKLSVSDERAGTKARCPRCKEVLEIPNAGEPPAPKAEDSFFVCPNCGAIGDPGATACTQFKASPPPPPPKPKSPKPARQVIHVESSSLLETGPFRWVREHLLWLGGAVLVGAITLLYGLIASPGSKAYDTYIEFADLLVQGEYEKAKTMLDSSALGQFEDFRSREFVGRMKRGAMSGRTLYTLNGEKLNNDGTTSTIHLNQEYWYAATGAVNYKNERFERDHSAKLVFRNGKWWVNPSKGEAWTWKIAK